VIALDPMLVNVDLTVVVVVLVKVLVAFAGLLVAVMLMIWFERKVISDMQNRIGPNKAGPFGILQSLADGIKFFFKEDLIPDRADRFVFKLAPYLSLVPAFLVFSVIPLAGNFSARGDTGLVEIAGKVTRVQVADPSIGLLFVLAMSSIAVYGVMLAGWSSGSKYPLLGSVRATAQMVSYEAALGLSALAVLLQSGFLETSAIVRSQTGYEWNIWMTGLIPFIIFFIASTAELNRPPFDLVEAEQELVGGFHTEYSSIRFALFFLAEFMNAITMSAVIVTLFLGGPSGPGLGVSGWVADYVLPFIWFFAKVMLFLFTLVWMRGTLPRFRYDQLMDLGWKFLIPLALGWLVVLVALRVSGDEGWNWGVVAVLIILGLTALAGLLTKSIRTAEERRELEEVND